MAVAGGTLEAFKFVAKGGVLHYLDKTRIAGSEVTDTIDEALQKLLDGKTVYLKAYGTNLYDLQQAWKNYHAINAA